MKLKKVEIEAFRAYKYKIDGTFDFTVDGDEPSDFVSIYAPNGFGKSSFYDAVEWALTNNVSRYIGDTYKKNNEIAAKGTKLEGVPQYILRNKDVDRLVETSVVVTTTEREFPRKMNNIRVDSRDIRFNDRDTEDGTRDFRNIILSQDAIDRFVREVKPEDRYDLFMEHFDGNAEEVRRNLHILVYENNSTLVELNSRRSNISQEIVSGDDENVFLEYNNTVNALVSSGEVVQPISSELSSVQEHEIVSSILGRKHQLNLELKHFDALVESLEKRLAGAGEIEATLLKKLDIEPEVRRISKGVGDSQKYLELFQLHKKKLEDQVVISEELSKLQELKSELPHFMGFYSVIEKNFLEYQRLDNVKSEFQSQFEKEELALKGIESAIGDCRVNLQRINELKVNAGNIYVEIANVRQLISSLDSEIEAIDANRNLDLAVIESKRIELAQVNSLNVSIEGLLSSDISSLNIGDSVVSDLTELKYKLVTCKDQLDGLLNVQNTLTEQSSTIERLVGLGLEYISLHPTKNCPLCMHEHPDDLVLKSAISDNTFASEALKSNSKMIELSLVLKEEVERRIKGVLSDVSNRKNEVSAAIRAAVQQLDENLNGYRERRLSLDAQRLNAVNKVSSRTSQVYGLEAADLEVRLSQDIVIATELLLKLSTDKNKIQENIDRLKVELKNLSGGMAVYQGRELSIKQTPLYMKFENFIRLNATDANGISIVLDQLLSNNSVATQVVNKDALELLARCNSLKAEMESEGNWLNIEFLKARQSELSLELAQYEIQTLTYFRGLSELVGDLGLQAEVEFKSAIEKKHTATRVSLERINVVLASYELLEAQLNTLIPYVQNIKRRKELAQLDVEIDKHSTVASILAGEMSNVTVCLEEQIRSYFYTDLINGIYKKIDPHPAFKKVEFFPRFGVGERPQLNIVISDEQGSRVSPNLYFSSAQLNILSLSVFLARAIHATHNGKPLGVILIDDPIHSMDSINVLSMIDMLRNISIQFDKQIIISTHDENFFELLQKKIPAGIFGSKFITLESYGVVAKHDWSKEKISIISPD